MVQPPMHWALEANLDEILGGLAWAAQAGADLCVLPELALTGFHRRLPEALQPTRLAAAERRLQDACAHHGLALAYGLPTLAEGGRCFNSYALIDANGRELARTHKQGLTPSEAGFFGAGVERAWCHWAGWEVGVVMCREVLDPVTLPRVPGRRLLLWPSYIGEAEMTGYLPAAALWARQTAAAVVHCNWPLSLNDPAGPPLAGSRLLRADGEEVASLPVGRVARAVWDVDGVRQRGRAGEAGVLIDLR